MNSDRVTTLYQKYGPTIYGRCRLLLGDEREAEDATQETFLRVHRRLDRVPDSREALFWIYRVATNYCLNEIRNRRTRALPIAELPEVFSNLGATEVRLEDRDLVRRLVDRAPTKARVAAWLYHVDGFEQDEIATIVGVSRRTVASRLALFSANARKYTRRSAA